jgi:DHA2 family multidrug resistance protein
MGETMSTSTVETPGATKKQWLAVFGALLGAFMAILDVSITNASLQDIQGGLGATLDEGAWISTAYLVAEIIVIPLTGYFSKVFSLKKYLLWNAAIFIVASILCGMARNLPSMILFRVLQGFSGGILIPTRSRRDVRSVHRPDDRWMADRELFLAVHFLHQSLSGPLADLSRQIRARRSPDAA